jgi:hypothetical protein
MYGIRYVQGSQTGILVSEQADMILGPDTVGHRVWKGAVAGVRSERERIYVEYIT